MWVDNRWAGVCKHSLFLECAVLQSKLRTKLRTTAGKVFTCFTTKTQLYTANKDNIACLKGIQKLTSKKAHSWQNKLNNMLCTYRFAQAQQQE